MIEDSRLLESGLLVCGYNCVTENFTDVLLLQLELHIGTITHVSSEWIIVHKSWLLHKFSHTAWHPSFLLSFSSSFNSLCNLGMGYEYLPSLSLLRASPDLGDWVTPCMSAQKLSVAGCVVPCLLI